MSARRAFTITLDMELTEQLSRFMNSNEISSQADATRLILRTHFSADPMTGAVQAGRRQAYDETKAWLVKEFLQSVDDVKRRLLAAGGLA